MRGVEHRDQTEGRSLGLGMLDLSEISRVVEPTTSLSTDKISFTLPR